MNKYTEIYGVDISKDVFDVVDSKGAYIKYPNGLKGFGQVYLSDRYMSPFG